MKTPMSSSIKLDKDEKETMDICLWYPKSDNFELIVFSDADFSDCRVERKRTSDTCHFLGHSLVSWHSKKQNSVALSTTKAEYIGAAFGFGTTSPPLASVTSGFSSFPMHLGFRVCASLSTSLISFIFTFLMALKRETTASRAQGKCPAKPSHPTWTEVRKKMSYDFRADFPDSNACILFEGYIWTLWPNYFHY
ncbi:hypothetical protein AAG906_035293 [Vitis piasezkii]